MSVLKGFWAETGGKVARHQKTRVQSWFMRHPTTFLFAWGTKGLVYNVPKATIRGGRNAVRRWKGKEPIKRKGSTSTAVETTTTVVTGPNGSTWTSTTTTERPQPETAGATGNVINLGEHRNSKRSRNAAGPIERGNTVESGRAMLGRTPLGVAFLHLAQEFDAFLPVRGYEATSTFNLASDTHKAFRMVSIGVDEFSDTIAACDLDRRVVNGLYKAVESAEAIATAMLKARRRIETAYSGQLSQEDSGAKSVQALPALVVGDEAAGIVPFGSAVAAEYESFAPEIDAEATSILERIKLSQAGFALLGASLEELARRMAQHNIDRRVRDLIRSAADHASSTATEFRTSRRTMANLYRGQLDQEDSSNGTIRTMPASRAS